MLEILNDMTNIKIASAYGVTDFSTGSTLNDQANAFGSYYFGDNVILCDPKSSIDNLCTYPQTLRKLKSFLSRADSIAKKNTTFNLDKLPPEAETQCIKRIDDENYEWYKSIPCGLVGQPKNKGKLVEPASLHDFTNMVYNELRRYKTFTTYYAHMLRINLQLEPYRLTSNPGFSIQQASNNANNMIYTSRQIEQTAQESIQHIAQIQFKFPLHI
jgi:hypothetical protein